MAGISTPAAAQEEGSDQSYRKFKGASRIIGPQWLHLPALTIGSLGVELFWIVELSYTSPYLLSLGLSKSQIAIVFVAGPLSGLIVHPLIGVLADNCTSRFGRRRPYMIVGTIICVFAMLLLGFTRQFASIFTGPNNDSNDLLTIWLAILSICIIDFSLNAVSAMDRALLVDTLPSTSQPQGNAWASRMLAIGAIAGCFVGNVDLTKIVPFFGKTQFQTLSVIACFLLLSSHFLMAVLIKEQILLPATDPTGKSNRKPFTQELKDIWTNILTLPRVIRQICFIQFFAWIGWFPVRLYTTIYIGDIYKRSCPVPLTVEAQIALDAEATRLGTRAFFWSSVIWLISNVVLPAFVIESASSGKQRPYVHFQGSSSRGTGWARMKGLVRVPLCMKIDMASLWALSHLIFAGCMFATFFTSSVAGATFMIGVTGLPWAVAQWAPSSLLGTAILTETCNDDDTIQLSDTRAWPRRVSGSDLYIDADVDERKVFFLDDSSDSDDDGVGQERKEESRAVLGDSYAQVSGSHIGGMSHEDGYQMMNDGRENGTGGEVLSRRGSLSAKAGIILGIHVIFIVIPQFLVTGLSSLIFAISDPKSTGPIRAPTASGTDVELIVANATAPLARVARSVLPVWLEVRQDTPDWTEEDGDTTMYEGSNSFVYIFRIGGIAAVVAAILSWRLAQGLRRR
ncbi:MFS general substrate transporter [Macrolepiota fuliginosa MF-IS2]|uniref:MFS general substrate transporter n=1 Tax=Macrolepiota fuliginosa MF-IS2 TaxID=1400762 RepID=A0A9P5WZM5_9AGAR|nr:MFS general substrate transporter [Macrolepiota fuliginosa MF-IS2]